MSIEEAVKARMDTTIGLKQFVGNRNYSITLPDDVRLPATVFSVVRESAIHAMGTDAGVKEVRIRVSSFSDDFSQCRKVDEQVRAALSRYRGTSATVVIQDILEENMIDNYHPEVEGGRHERIRDFRVFYEV